MDKIGQHCHVQSCHQLDFLPFKCDACGETFCLDHRSFSAHSCKNPKDSHTLDCPLCDQPVEQLPNEDANHAVIRHQDSGCESAEARRKRESKCTVKGCKKISLIPFNCNKCHKNYCTNHRTYEDHAAYCVARVQSQLSLAQTFAKVVRVKS